MTAATLDFVLEKASLADVVRAAQAGDRRAFAMLVERYEQSVFATALKKLGNHAEAQELTQEVFMQALRKVGQLREPEAIGGWLRSITRRMAINRAVRGGAVVSTEQETLEAACRETETPLTNALAHERATKVRDGLGRLRALDRDTLVAFYVDGQSLIEMSLAFDSPVGTIKRRLHMARKRLAVELEELAPA